MPSTVKVIADGQEEVEITLGPGNFSAIVSPQQVRVDVPGFHEINSRLTVKCMEEMSERAWRHISTGPLFRELFFEVYPESEYRQGIPATQKELMGRDYGVIHVCGLIVLTIEHIFAWMETDRSEPVRVFFRTPEDHTHPKAQRRLTALILKMMRLAGGPGDGEGEAAAAAAG